MTAAADSLSALYEATSDKTLAAWRTAPDCGEVMPQPFYDPHKLAMASGIRPAISADLSALRNALHSLTQGDPLADVMPATALHFTFLPLTLPLYSNDERPEDLIQLQTLWQPWQRHDVHIHELRLVALPNQLLLAGIPDAQSLQARLTFCDALLHSPWHDRLVARHANTPLPPPFWHTTLLRYRAQYLPLHIRHFFEHYRHHSFGTVEGALTLAQVNYNWSHVVPI